MSKFMIRHTVIVQNNITTELLLNKRIVNNHYFFIWITSDTICAIGEDKKSGSH